MLEKRMLCLKIEREQEAEDVFATAVASALREYASAVDKAVTDASYRNQNGAGCHDNETFMATNGCKIEALHSIESINLEA